MEFGAKLALFRNSHLLCLGKVGSGEKVCLKFKGDCHTRAHKTYVVEFEHNVCLMVCSGESNAFLRPALDALLLKGVTILTTYWQTAVIFMYYPLFTIPSLLNPFLSTNLASSTVTARSKN